MNAAIEVRRAVELNFAVNTRSEVAVYVQIENQIRCAIASGRLKPDDQLPSVRELSRQLRTNPNTVTKAYRDLEVIGLLYTRPGMGVYVADNAQVACRRACQILVVEKLFEVVQEAWSAGLSKTEFSAIVSAAYLAESGQCNESATESIEVSRRRISPVARKRKTRA